MRISRHEETITWIDPDDELPDAEITVLLFVPGHSAVWPGYYDDEECEWRIDGIGLDHPVVAWAEMPSGPLKREVEE